MLYTRWTLDLACTVAMILCCRSSSRLEHLPTPPLACHSRADPRAISAPHHTCTTGSQSCSFEKFLEARPPLVQSNVYSENPSGMRRQTDPV
eukprot:6136033-Amphidinium_carterae.1